MSLPHYLSDVFAFTHDIHIHGTRQTSHTRPFTSVTVNSSNSFFNVKVHLYGTEFPLPSSKKHKHSFAVSIKAIVIKGYE